MVFNTKNEKIINEIYSILKNQLSEEYKELFISRGMYKDLPVIQIGTSRKDKAIQKTEKLLGIPQDSMLRIGDCGDIKGNDFAMLNCNQGYSVDKINNDDNVLTGKTLQLSVNSLYDSNINVKNICIVRYPSINRLDQMFMGNTCAIDYNLFFNYIYGLCFNSPYSWKDNEWKKDNGKYDYTDSLGVFDLNRKKIIECLIKNHDFSECSEVGEYKRRLV